MAVLSLAACSSGGSAGGASPIDGSADVGATGAFIDAQAPSSDAPVVDEAGGVAVATSDPCGFVGLSGAQCTLIKGTILQAELPASRGNRVADNADAASLGFQLFFDPRFSSNTNVRCATCHLPEHAFSDGRAVAKGLDVLTRNAPTVLNAARMHLLFWDGRADSVWSQPLFALENPLEMNFTRLEVVHKLQHLYQPAYEKVFGPMPDTNDLTRFPARGKVGDPAYDGMKPDDQAIADTIVANYGKSIEAYLRKLNAGRSPVDRFLLGEPAMLTDSVKRGIGVFVRAACITCHNGPMFSDEKFHNLGIQSADAGAPDRGRADGVTQLVANKFNALGHFSDAPPPSDLSDYQANDAQIGAYRTPSLRNLARSAPYGHNGMFDTLEEIVDFKLGGGNLRSVGGGPSIGTIDPTLQPHTLTPQERLDLLEMLRSMTGDYPTAPWNNWPGGAG